MIRECSSLVLELDRGWKKFGISQRFWGFNGRVFAEL